jgi:membrane associated rhomboid family serine protease
VLIPLGTDRPLRRKSVVTPAIVGLCVVAHLMMMVAGSRDEQAAERVMSALAVTPGAGFHWWQLVTSAFLHGSWMHLLGNMLFLWIFGQAVEDKLGRVGFAVLYLGAAAISGGLHAALESVPAIGASGAIAGVTGAFMVLFPRTVVRVFSLFIILGVFTIPAVWFIGAQIAWDFLAQATGRDDGVARIAHLAGYGTGIVTGMVLLALRIVPRDGYDLFTYFSQKRRLAALRGAVESSERERVAKIAPKPRAKEDPDAGAIAEMRRLVSEAAGRGEFAEAARRYRELLARFAGRPGAATMGRRTQIDLANHFAAEGDHTEAAAAYQRFLDTYPQDAEGPRVMLLLGIIAARYLNDPVRAKTLLGAARERLHGEERELAEGVLRDLG